MIRAFFHIKAALDEFRDDVKRRLHNEYVAQIESRLRDEVEHRVSESVRIRTEAEMVRKFETFLKNVPSQTRDGYIKLLRNGRWKDQSARGGMAS